MDNIKTRIGIFTYSKTMLEHVKNLKISQDDIVISISKYGLDEAIPIAQAMEKEGVEVIISQMVTSHLLREKLQVPVLSFPHSGLDMVLALKKASNIGNKILFPYFRNKLGAIEDFISLFKINVIQRMYEDANSLEAIVIEGKEQGCDVVVGGPFTVKFAKEQGLKTVEIQTSEEMVEATIENAKSAAKSNRARRAELLKYQTIMDSISEGIITVDQNGIVTTANTTAVKLLDLKDNKYIMSHIFNVIPKSRIIESMKSKKIVHDSIESVNDKHYVFYHTPLIMNDFLIGGVLTFRDVNEVMKAENNVRKNLSKGFIAKYSIENLIYSNLAMKEVVSKINEFSGSDSTLLITGETGTGKEIVAQSVHNLSKRAKKPFVSLNCAALPEQLLESELFGYEEGAFTGSRKGGKPGLFEIAHTGTLFLDEISAAPDNVQIHLLRVLQEREVMRIGSHRFIPIDVRIIAAANKDLGFEVQKKRFREDLFYRLNILRINIPPLRKRTEDIPLLAKTFIETLSTINNKKIFEIPEKYLDILVKYHWPGNVRQLRNLIERLVLLSQSPCSPKLFEEIYNDLIDYSDNSENNLENQYVDGDVTFDLMHENIKQQMQESEQNMILMALRSSSFNKGKAAKKLGMSRSTLWRKMKEHRLHLSL